MAKTPTPKPTKQKAPKKAPTRAAASEIDVTQFGFRLPASLTTPTPLSGDEKLDAAIAALLAGDVRAAARRLDKPRPDDLPHLEALLSPAALDLGAANFDVAGAGAADNPTRGPYLAAYDVVLTAREARARHITTLLFAAMQHAGHEPLLQRLLPDIVRHAELAFPVLERLVEPSRQVAPETLALAGAALDLDGEPSRLQRLWVLAARAVVALGPEVAFERLGPRLATARAAAVAEALTWDTKNLDPRWRPLLLPLALAPNQPALALLWRLPPDDQILDVFAAYLTQEIAATGYMFTQWAFEHLVAHAGETAIARWHEGLGASIRAGQSARK